MLQIMTGPFGRIAYHDSRTRMDAAYPVMNIPCDAFACARDVVAANDASAPGVVQLAQFDSRGASGVPKGNPLRRG